jgi:hypothetical protein
MFAGILIGAFGFLAMFMLIVAHRNPPPTMHYRRQWRDLPERLGPDFERVLHDNLWDLYATDPTPPSQPPWERNLFSELKEGMQELERRREEGIDYQWINLTGEER